ncbi:hypothetical protein Anas_07757 [Armadillidium nasatum]|uniref:Uncharacterized protein n=1 Tax=Armadillidium nasatum TaxID=96803 RepID=A0A5N5TL23_9CRUS|nr:hypothetical protein Anas_07757 [Armadillidium nasatum]
MTNIADVDAVVRCMISEAVYQEYDTLKTRYEVDAEAMAKAFSRASEWYIENKSLRRETATLKRQSAMLLQKVSAASDGDLSSLAELAEVATKEDDAVKEVHAHYEKEISKLMEDIKIGYPTFLDKNEMLISDSDYQGIGCLNVLLQV